MEAPPLWKTPRGAAYAHVRKAPPRGRERLSVVDQGDSIVVTIVDILSVSRGRGFGRLIFLS